VQAAWVVLIRPKTWERHGLRPWIEAAAAQAFQCEHEVDRAAETPFRRTGQQAWASEAELLI